ncbi:MAG TPA: hypothetical protein VE465_17810 [Streptosporangiaceae bacterium]|jgi:hypothetical protein|nr:hypothetical protein [Streptosporangiaceae bacterium]
MWSLRASTPDKFKAWPRAGRQDPGRRVDQVTIVEADSLEESHAAATEFRMGAKAQYIEIADVVVGIKAPPRALAQ